MGKHTPGFDVVIHQPEVRKTEVLDEVGVADHDVNAGAAINADTRPSLHGRHCTADDGVSLDHLDVEAGSGEIAGCDQPVVSRTDDHHVSRARAHRSTPMMAYASGLPGNRKPQHRSVKPYDR